MIPPKNDQKWQKLVRGEIKVQFKIFAANMLLGRCQRTLAKDPSQAALYACIDEAHAFFSKYEALYKDELLSVF